MQALLKPLLELAEYEDIVKKKKEAPGVLMLTGCVNSQKTHMMYALSDGCCYKVIACSSEAKAKQIYEEYRFLALEQLREMKEDQAIKLLDPLGRNTAPALTLAAFQEKSAGE